MACACVAKIKLQVKDYPCYDYKNTIGEELTRKPAKGTCRFISLHKNKSKNGVMSEQTVLQVIANIDGKHRGAPKQTRVLVGGIEITCIYFLYEIKVNKVCMRENQTM